MTRKAKVMQPVVGEATVRSPRRAGSGAPSRSASPVSVRVASGTAAEQRRRFLLALRELDEAWVEAFHETGFSDVYFSRLFSELWLQGGAAVAKTDAYNFVKGVGVQTAMKYVRRAIEEGYLIEVDNPADGRSRLIQMSPSLKQRFEQLMDRSVEAFTEAFAKRD